MNPNKNFRRVVEAMIRIDAKDVGIVIAGGRDSKVFRQGTALPDRVRGARIRERCRIESAL